MTELIVAGTGAVVLVCLFYLGQEIALTLRTWNARRRLRRHLSYQQDAYRWHQIFEEQRDNDFFSDGDR